MNIKTSPLMLRAATLIALALPSLPALAIEPFTADYQASYMGLQANGTMSVVAQGNNRWRYSLNIRNQVANLSQNTVFDEKDGRYRPLSGSDHSLMLIKKKNVDATYDWDKREATWSGDIKPDRAGPVSLQAGDMDGLLMNLALARDVAAGKPLNYRLVEDGRAKPMSYQIAGKESVTVEGKLREATKVIRGDGKRQIVAWVVPGIPVPVRIVQRENGSDTLDLTIKSLR
ncbi:MAG TPA: DUF3108 domain-containing protein [Xanthomonadaceae bacterium]|nr:DUF3108 domain-containing protein [Xanthomonadaceae bacterium]